MFDNITSSMARSMTLQMACIMTYTMASRKACSMTYDRAYCLAYCIIYSTVRDKVYMAQDLYPLHRWTQQQCLWG